MRCEPAATIVKLFGGEVAVCKILGVSYTVPYKWQYPKDQPGSGGMIPVRYYRPLLDYAAANGIKLTAEDFLPIRETAPCAPSSG